MTNNIYNPTSRPVDPRVPWLSGDAALTARTHPPTGLPSPMDGAQLANFGQARTAPSAQAAAARPHTAGGRERARQAVRGRLHLRRRRAGVPQGNLRASLDAGSIKGLQLSSARRGGCIRFPINS